MKLSAIWHFFFGSGAVTTVFTGSGAATLQKITAVGAGTVVQPVAAVVPGPVPFGIIVPTGERWIPEFTVKLPRQHSIDRVGWGSATLSRMQASGTGQTVAPIAARVGIGHATLRHVTCSGWGEMDLTYLEDEEIMMFV